MSRDAALVQAQEDFDAAMAVAQKPFDIAQAKFEVVASKTRESHDSAVTNIYGAYDKEVAETTERHKIAENEARATVYRLGQEQRAVRNTVNQHRNQILSALGIKLDEID